MTAYCPRDWRCSSDQRYKAPALQHVHASGGFRQGVELLIGGTASPKVLGQAKAWHFLPERVLMCLELSEQVETESRCRKVGLGQALRARTRNFDFILNIMGSHLRVFSRRLA